MRNTYESNKQPSQERDKDVLYTLQYRKAGSGRCGVVDSSFSSFTLLSKLPRTVLWAEAVISYQDTQYFILESYKFHLTSNICYICKGMIIMFL